MTYYVEASNHYPPLISPHSTFFGRELNMPPATCEAMIKLLQMHGELEHFLTKVYNTPPEQHPNMVLPSFIAAAVAPKTNGKK